MLSSISFGGTPREENVLTSIDCSTLGNKAISRLDVASTFNVTDSSVVGTSPGLRRMAAFERSFLQSSQPKKGRTILVAWCFSVFIWPLRLQAQFLERIGPTTFDHTVLIPLRRLWA